MYLDTTTGKLHLTDGHRYLELGGGAHPVVRPNVDARMCYAPDGSPTVDFVVDLEKPFTEEHGQGISTAEFDGVFSRYALEHCGWRVQEKLFSEIARVTKPGGGVTLILPNTEAQMEHLLHTQDWEDAGSMLFGGQDYGENAHKAFLNPVKVSQLLIRAGYENVSIAPWGEKKTDMVVQATKIALTLDSQNVDSEAAAQDATAALLPQEGGVVGEDAGVNADLTPPISDDELRKQRAEMFRRPYFDGPGPHGGYGFYRDFPVHQHTANHILQRRPESVLALGEGRGYVLKRLIAAGVPGTGIDISRHCFLTRVTDDLMLADATDPQTWNALGDRDLCYSIAFLDHVPEQLLPYVFEGMKLRTERGLHGVNTKPDQGGDLTRCTIQSLDWWRSKLPKGHEVVEKDELEAGNYPASYLQGDGKLKVHLGCATTMFHHGWINCDILDQSQYAQANGYQFLRHDCREPLPWGTESVDLLVMHHALEHFTYAEGRELLRECRRVLKPGGAMRLSVPDGAGLACRYASGSYPSYEGGREVFGLLSDFDELSGTCAAAKTDAGKLYELLHAHHQSLYDADTLKQWLLGAGFDCELANFDEVAPSSWGGCINAQEQILRETQDGIPDLSLFFGASVPPL